MLWANFLHLYQPADQNPDTLQAIVTQSYKPLLEGMLNSSRVRVTLNVTGALLELFDAQGYGYLIDALKKLVHEGKVELTGSCKYHAFLPLLPKEEGLRQITLNSETLRYFFGSDVQLRGFFPPEMGFSEDILPLIRDAGFDWVLLDEIAYAKGEAWPNSQVLYKTRSTQGASPLGVFFRDRRISNLIMSAVVRTGEVLYEAVANDMLTKKYLVTAMDGETFGHHRPGLEKLLFEIFDSPKYELVTLSELYNMQFPTEDVSPCSSTWASSKKDIDEGAQFLSWYDKSNEIHGLQWEFLEFARQEVGHVADNEGLRHKLDIAFASDHFWWASAKPWWSLEMVEAGAHRLLEIIEDIPNVPEDILAKARYFYSLIISTAFDWQRSGKIREMAKAPSLAMRIPFKDRTVGAGGAEEGVYYAFVDMLNRLEREAAAKGEYEQAILWRDALYKLDKKLDIYETINAVDLLRKHIPHAEVEHIIEKYKKDYQKIRGGQPEQRGS